MRAVTKILERNGCLDISINYLLNGRRLRRTSAPIRFSTLSTLMLVRGTTATSHGAADNFGDSRFYLFINAFFLL